jgi:hypothetical protein
VEEGLHALQKRSSFGCCVDCKAIEIFGEPHISKETSRVFVEVKEGPRSVIEDASLLLAKLIVLSKVVKKTFKPIKCRWRRVLHRRSTPDLQRRLDRVWCARGAGAVAITHA